MSDRFVFVTEQRAGVHRLVNVAHIQQVIDHGDGTTLLRFARQAMLDQSVVEVETFEDDLHVRETFVRFATCLGAEAV